MQGALLQNGPTGSQGLNTRQPRVAALLLFFSTPVSSDGDRADGVPCLLTALALDAGFGFKLNTERGSARADFATYSTFCLQGGILEFFIRRVSTFHNFQEFVPSKWIASVQFSKDATVLLVSGGNANLKNVLETIGSMMVAQGLCRIVARNG